VTKAFPQVSIENLKAGYHLEDDLASNKIELLDQKQLYKPVKIAPVVRKTKVRISGLSV
jgi:hypothetical protein